MAHIRLERTIWPVGHGAFYTEQFKDERDQVLFTAVYDCGSEQLKTLKKCIDEFLSRSEISHIDALFISHFHYDHVNSLDYLLSKIRVKDLFVPQLTDDYILSILGTSTYIRSEENQRLALDVLQRLYSGEGLENVEHLYEVPQITNDNLPEAEYREQDYKGTYKYEKAPLIYTYNHLWEYIPCNIFAPCQDLIDEFVANNYGDGNGNVDINVIFDALKQGKWKKVQAIYKKVFPNSHNEYSMTVYSGMARNINIANISTRAYTSPVYYWDRPYYYMPYPFQTLDREVGCLYTGDFEAKTHVHSLKRFYNQNFGAWRKVAILQIPHHGSYNNYDDELYDFPKLTFASVALRDKYGHPHIRTLIDITNHDCPIVVVQNNKATALITIYNFEV